MCAGVLGDGSFNGKLPVRRHDYISCARGILPTRRCEFGAIIDTFPSRSLLLKNRSSCSQELAFMASQSLSQRLQALTDTYRNTLTLIQRLQKLPSTPGSFGNSEADPRLELSSEIHQSLKEQEDELDTISSDLEDTESFSFAGYASIGAPRRRQSEHTNEKERLIAAATKLREDLKAYETLHFFFVLTLTSRQRSLVLPQSPARSQTLRRYRAPERARTTLRQPQQRRRRSAPSASKRPGEAYCRGIGSQCPVGRHHCAATNPRPAATECRAVPIRAADSGRV